MGKKLYCNSVGFFFYLNIFEKIIGFNNLLNICYLW